MRDRLLAKAAAARADVDGERPSTSEIDEQPAGFSSLGTNAVDEMTSELDELAGPLDRSSSRGVRIAGQSLSPIAVLVFATLLGLAACASLFTLLIQFSPRDGTPAHAIPRPTAITGLPPIEQPVPTASPPEARTPRRKVEGPWRIGTAKAGQKVIRGKIGKEPFLRAIQEAGVPKDQAYRVLTALKDEKNLDHCRPNDEFVALLESQSNRVLAFEYIASREDIYQAVEKDGLLRGAKLDLKVKRHRVQGAIVLTTNSFAEAAKAADFEGSLGWVLNDALNGHTSVEEFSRGDRLRVVVQEVTILGEFYRYAGVEALEYLPKEGKPLRIYYHPVRKKYYDARGRSPGEGGWRKPVKGAPITSRFNPKRMHPILKKRMPHNGTDFGAATGTPVGASSPGEIIKLGNYGPNGNFIAIKHRGGYETGYSHLSRFEPGLKVGDKVKRMQVIGYVGSTGRSTGPHLHFSAKKNGKFIDPESLQLDALTVLGKADRDKFSPVRANYDALLESVPLPPIPAPAAPPVANEPATSNLALQAEAVQQAPSTPVPALAAPASQPAGSGTASPPAPRRTGGLLYLSDKELIESQSVTDDGEVEE